MLYMNEKKNVKRAKGGYSGKIEKNMSIVFFKGFCSLQGISGMDSFTCGHTLVVCFDILFLFITNELIKRARTKRSARH